MSRGGPGPRRWHRVAAQVLVRLPWLPSPHRGSPLHSGLPLPPPRGAGAGGRARRGSAVLTCGRTPCSAPLPPGPPQDVIPSPWCIPRCPQALGCFPSFSLASLPAAAGQISAAAGAGVRVLPVPCRGKRAQAGQSAADRFRSGSQSGSQPRRAEFHFCGFFNLPGLFYLPGVFFPPKLSTSAGWERDGIGLSCPKLGSCCAGGRGRQHRSPMSQHQRLFRAPQPDAGFRVYFLPPTWKMPARLLLTAPRRAAEPLPPKRGRAGVPRAGRPRAPFS